MSTPADPEAQTQEAQQPAEKPPSLYSQYVIVSKLAKIWNDLTEGQRQAQLQLIAPRLQRCAAAGDAAQDVLLRILQLPDEEIYEALSWTPSEFTPAPGEEVYEGLEGWLGRYMSWARPGNTALGFHFWSGIAALSAACQRRVFVPAGRRIYMNMFIILGGVRSVGKGQAFDPAIAILRRVNSLMEDRPDYAERRVNILPGDSTMESLVSELANRVNTKSIEDEKTGMIEVLKTEIDATGILPLDEMATFFGKDAWAQARRAPFLTTLKESDRYEKRTKTGGLETLKNLAISMIACCAPDWMHNTIETDLLGGGFMDRTVWVYREPLWTRRRGTSIVTSPPKDPLQLQLLAEWLVDNVLSINGHEPAQLDDLVRQRLHNIYQDLVDREQEFYEQFGSDSQEKTANRKIWLITQLATLISMSEETFPPIVVRQSHVEKAYEIVRAEDLSMKTFMEEGMRSKSVYWDRQFLAYIKDDCDGCVTRSNLNQRFRRHMNSTEDSARIVKNLLDQELIEEVKFNNRITYRLKEHVCPRCQPGVPN